MKCKLILLSVSFIQLIFGRLGAQDRTPDLQEKYQQALVFIAGYQFKEQLHFSK